MHQGRMLIAASLFALAGATPAAWAQVTPEVVREGEGARRAALTKRELKPFDFGAFSNLSEWTNGGAMSPTLAADKPILIVTWTDYIPASKRAIALARKMSEKHGAEGLIVIAAHSAQEWASAAKPAAPKDCQFLIALDKDGAFRKAIDADADPDFYVIDRSGQLRFADIDSSSVEKACEIVTKETKEAAAGINEKLKADAAAKDAELRKTAAARQSVDLTNLPEIPFEEPSADAYKTASGWPMPPRDPNANQNLQPGQKPPDPFDNLPKFSVGDTGWLPAKPEEKGKITLLYFWHPDATRFLRQIDEFELYQRQHARDITVVGVISPIAQSGGQNKFNMDQEHLNGAAKKFLSQKALKQHFLLDLDGKLWEESIKFYQTDGYPIPWGMLVASDGTVRWWGYLRGASGQAAIDRMLAVDPGVVARRKAEEAYIKALQK